MFFIFPNSNFHSHKFGYTREEEKAVVDSRKTKKGSDYLGLYFYFIDPLK